MVDNLDKYINDEQKQKGQTKKKIIIHNKDDNKKKITIGKAIHLQVGRKTTTKNTQIK